MKQLILKSRKYFVVSLLLMLFSVACEKPQNTPVPNVPVSFTINLNIVNELTVATNSVYFPNVGYGGIIVYCELPGSYYAFDATCTHEVSRGCIVKNEGVLAECPCCESQFILISGAYPSRGPAEMPLKQYNVSVVNDFTLRVYN
jgi:Rieske Fe-S protein